MSTSFTKTDLVAGLTPDFFLTLIDDVKWRDTFGKFIQYALRTSAAFITDFDVLDEKSRKSTALTFNTAAGHISLGRRIFRFIRWTRNVQNFFSDVGSYKPTIVGLLHATASISACICEDITTLGKLGLLSSEIADRFVMPGNYCWFTESMTGFIIHGLRLRACSNEYNRARNLYLTSRKDEACDSNVLLTRKQFFFKAYVALHFAKINFTKWACEVVASSHDSQFHTSTKAALVASLISAFVSTYSHSSKFFPTKKSL